MSPLAPRPGILDIAPYVGGLSAIEGSETIIKLSSNEGAFGPSPKAIEACRKAAPDMHRYPDSQCSALRGALGDAHGIDPARIVCGDGSDELIGLLCQAYAGPGDQVLYSQYGFLMYPIAAKSVGATPVAAPETNLTADVDELLGKVTDKTRILFLANPNNPTGSYLNASEMKRLRDGLPETVLLVIDAAYAEFVTHDDYDAGIELVDGGENVVMTRTFSKIYALGGLRLGWAYCPPPVADALNRLRGPFNVSSLAQAAGVAALSDTDFFKRCRTNNNIWRPWTANKLRGLGLTVPPSAGNFKLVRFPGVRGKTAEAADAFLKSHGIITRAMGAYGLDDSLRVTIGREEEMCAFIDALTEFMS